MQLLPADERQGPWHHFLVGLAGLVAADEPHTWWPNRVCTLLLQAALCLPSCLPHILGLLQVIHGERVAYNLRDGADVARFLSVPTWRDVLQHLQNLQ